MRTRALWETYWISPTEYVVIRVRDYAGYRPAPQLEGKVTVESFRLRNQAESETFPTPSD